MTQNFHCYTGFELKIFRTHRNKKLRERKFGRHFGEFKVYIFLLKVLLYLLIIFWKIRIDTLYEENDYTKIPSPSGNPTRKIPTHQTLRFENFLPENWHPENSHLDYYHRISHFINYFSSFSTSF